MKIFDTASGGLEELDQKEISMYVCGPTVYDLAHLGHGRSAVAFDVIRRYFLYKGWKVRFVSNYTDIDDKMIKRASEEGISVKELTNKVIPEYEKDYGDLKVMVPTVQPKATEHINEMVEIIEKLEEAGNTYVIEGDGVYFDVSSWPDYGKFSGQDLDELQMGARVDVKVEKRNPQDFALWKFEKDEPYDDYWNSPWGSGRPGWHIECSAMSYKHLGEAFDIHGGGLDLVFPHHECEVAQTKGAFGKEAFSKYWMHNGFIQVDNEKMSKSLGNFFTLRDIFKKYDPSVVRFMFLQTHYRNPVNFSDKLLDQAKAGLRRIIDCIAKLESAARNPGNSPLPAEEIFVAISEAIQRFQAFMDNDFDTSGALGVVFDFVKFCNKKIEAAELTIKDHEAILSFFDEIDSIFAVFDYRYGELTDEIDALIKERDLAREAGDYAKADEIRDKLLERDIVLEDTPSGTIWKDR